MYPVFGTAQMRTKVSREENKATALFYGMHASCFVTMGLGVGVGGRGLTGGVCS